MVIRSNAESTGKKENGHQKIMNEKKCKKCKKIAHVIHEKVYYCAPCLLKLLGINNE
jgi:hypothetical protein